MNWTGEVTRDLTGFLRHDEDEIRLAGEHAVSGEIRLRGEAPNKHWMGHISSDRKTWLLKCQYSFEIRGDVTFERGRYALTQTHHTTPIEFLLPNEQAEKVVA